MKIIVLPGDGIGPEITAASVAPLDVLNERFGLGLDLVEMEIGFKAIEAAGTSVPEPVRDACDAAAGVILGPVDTFAYPKEEEVGINPSKFMRTEFDLYANIRPSKTRDGVPSVARKMDLVICRENTEGLYADRNMFMGSGEFMPTEDVALSVRKITRQGCARIAKTAFDLAMRRRKKVTAVHKANVLKMTDGLFLEVVRDLAQDYPEVEVEELIVDAMTAHLIRRPETFDVVVTTNAFGDILSDEAAELSGGLGLGGALNAGDNHGIAQAAHGAAPDIAGQGVANPTALMLSTSMMLEWVGQRHDRDDIIKAAKAYEDAVEAALGDADARTPDVGGNGGTERFGARVAELIAG